ncbi:phage holin family protein [Niabella insulamsoli]|uniref:phage holin family protein n=1 Tax=Niabella insulamsoli TaxID=3144874 RepID=UPI0031FE0A1A
MFDVKDKIHDIVDNVEDIAKTYYRLSVIQVADKGSKLGASLVVVLLLFGILLFAMFFACLGLSWWIGQKLDNQMLGFFIVAGGLFVIVLITLLFKKKIVNFIRNIIINKIYG